MRLFIKKKIKEIINEYYYEIKSSDQRNLLVRLLFNLLVKTDNLHSLLDKILTRDPTDDESVLTERMNMIKLVISQMNTHSEHMIGVTNADLIRKIFALGEIIGRREGIKNLLINLTLKNNILRERRELSTLIMQQSIEHGMFDFSFLMVLNDPLSEENLFYISNQF